MFKANILSERKTSLNFVANKRCCVSVTTIFATISQAQLPHHLHLELLQELQQQVVTPFNIFNEVFKEVSQSINTRFTT
jgi:hypothetical protein